ncbi:MAG: biotin transporter BioY [Pseudomonadota bacterium]
MKLPRAIWPDRQSLSGKAVLLLLGSAVLSLSSYVAIPMVPVPITMQTLAVTVIGAVFGWRLGMTAVWLWLAYGATGLPVFAGGASGLSHFVGPTAGYLFAFPFAAAVTGWLVSRGWNHKTPKRAFAAMLIGNLICLSVGAVWLAFQTGLYTALINGFLPFLVGAVIKSALGAIIVILLARLFAAVPVPPPASSRSRPG